MTATERRRVVGADRVARLFTSVFAPAHLVIVLLLLVGAASHPSRVTGLAWGTLAALLVGLVPYAWVLYAVRRGRFTSRHVPERTQRLLPLAVAAAAALIGLGVLVIVGGPRQLVVLVLAMLTGLVVVGVITKYWKVSLHTAVAGGTSAILALVLGPTLLSTALVVVGVGWSRVHRRDHTVPQALVGGLLGAAVAVAVFASLR